MQIKYSFLEKNFNCKINVVYLRVKKGADWFVVANSELGVAAIGGLVNAITLPQNSVAPRRRPILFTEKTKQRLELGI